MSPPLFSMRKLRWYSKSGLLPWGADRLLILVTHHLVTHHLAAARNADATLVLDQGQLVGLACDIAARVRPICRAVVVLSHSLEGELDRADLSDKRETT